MKGFHQLPADGAALERTFEQAVAFHTAGRHAEAETLFAAILKKQPAHFGALHGLGAIRRQQGRGEESLPLLKKALLFNPNSADAHNSAGNTLQALDRHEEVIERYRRALNLRPAYPDAHNNLGNSYKALHRLDEAADSYRHAIRLRPAFAAAHSNPGKRAGYAGASRRSRRLFLVVPYTITNPGRTRCSDPKLCP